MTKLGKSKTQSRISGFNLRSRCQGAGMTSACRKATRYPRTEEAKEKGEVNGPRNVEFREGEHWPKQHRWTWTETPQNHELVFIFFGTRKARREHVQILQNKPVITAILINRIGEPAPSNHHKYIYIRRKCYSGLRSTQRRAARG